MMRNLVQKPLMLAATISIMSIGAAFAQGASVNLGVSDHDSSIPVEITSESLELNQKEGFASFTGDVFVRQGDMTLTCERMVVEYGENPETGAEEIQKIHMYKGVTFASPSEAAESESAVYDLQTNTIVMTGNVLVTQGRTALSSERLSYNLDSGAGQMTGNVKTVLQQASN